jgi:hypothetical protein
MDSACPPRPVHEWRATRGRGPQRPRPVDGQPQWHRLRPRRAAAGDHAANYATEYRSYARALGRVAPSGPLFAPALAEPNRDRDWISALLAGPHPRLAAITVHEYPYSGCEPVGSGAYPESSFATVSNTFATALWAPRALFTLARAGAASADLHVRVLFSANAPFRFHRDGIFARPLLYGLALFKRMLGPDSHLVQVHLRAPVHSQLTAWAVTHGRHSISVLLLNDGTRSLNVRVGLPRANAGTATVQRLLARTAWSREHVTLAGQHLNTQARWTGRRVIEDIPAHDGKYVVSVRHTSGALISFPLAEQPARDPRRRGVARSRRPAHGPTPRSHRRQKR